MRILASLFTLLVISSVSAQNILVADNNPNAPTGPHVYNTLQAAVDAATPGDIIHVIPSSTSYDGTTDIFITQNDISIYGIGFFPQKDGPQVATVDAFQISANNVRISGLKITNNVYFGHVLGSYSGITIENSEIRNINSNTSGSLTYSNILVRGCILNRDGGDATPALDFSDRINQSVVSNTIIVGYRANTTTNYDDVVARNGTIFKNCIFYGNGRLDKPTFGQFTNNTVSNCIFFGKYPGSNGALFENNVFNNNVAVGSQNITLPPPGTGSGNAGTGNFTAVTDSSTIFTDANIFIPASNSGTLLWSYLWNAEVANVALQNSGTDGTDIGIKGGTIPFSQSGTPLPLVKRLIIPEVIKQGDNLNATIEAEGY